MNFLRRFAIGPRLAAGFGLLLALTLLILAVALYGNRQQDHLLQQIREVSTVKVQLFNRLLDNNNDMTRVRREMLLKGGKDQAADEAELQRLRGNYDGLWAEYARLPVTPAGQQLRDDIAAKRKIAQAINRHVSELVSAGDLQGATDYTIQTATPAMAAWNQAIAKGIAFVERQQKLDNDNLDRIGDRTGKLLLVFGTLSLLLGALAAWLTTRSLTGPLAQAVRIADDVAAGKLDNRADVRGNDEPAQLLRSLSRMQDQLKAVIAAQLEMARTHDEGTFSFRMDEAAFPGEYGRMVHEVNALAGSHIDAVLGIIAFVQRYAIGDLSEDFPRMPGEKAVAHEAMDTVKASLQAINGEIQRLSRAAAAGDFAVRGDSGRFQHAFRAMVDNLNDMMATADGNLAALSRLLQAIAGGDLTQRMQGEFHGVFARMRDDANTTVARLTDIVGRIQQATAAITTAAGEIATGNDDLSRRTEQQAANLEETAASMEELTSTVRQNAEHARQADQAAAGADQAVQDTVGTIAEVVQVMNQINESSARITDIISVIDGIAFQTNILALNAAVEAARAGEQGRGFAVVASEVRTLAQRSATAAKEIKELILESGQRVENGLAISHQSEQAIGRLSEAARKTNGLINEIAAASAEQATGIEQVNQTVMQMDETTQQNAALVEEATAAARSLEEQAAQLDTAVAVFKLDARRAA